MQHIYFLQLSEPLGHARNKTVLYILIIEIQYRSDPAWQQSEPQLNPGITFGGYMYSGFTLCLLFEKLGRLRVYFGFTFGLLGNCI